jgi:hypothetical protein
MDLSTVSNPTVPLRPSFSEYNTRSCIAQPVVSKKQDFLDCEHRAASHMQVLHGVHTRFVLGKQLEGDFYTRQELEAWPRTRFVSFHDLVVA